MVNAITPLPQIEVTCDMSDLTSRAGTALLSGLSDAIGSMDGLVQGLFDSLDVHDLREWIA